MRNFAPCFVFVFTLPAIGCTSSGDDGGGDDQGPFCGDGTCNVGENTANCAADCPATGPFCGDGTCNGTETDATCAADCNGAGCTMADVTSCAGDSICLDGDCVAAFGRAYTVVAYEASVPQFKPDGSTWDATGGAPDPYAVIFLNGQNLGMTTAIQDTFTPLWNQSTQPTVIAAGSTFRIDVYDEDIADDDGVLSCELTPVTADHLHLGGVYCSGDLGSVTFLFLTQ